MSKTVKYDDCVTRNSIKGALNMTQPKGKSKDREVILNSKPRYGNREKGPNTFNYFSNLREQVNLKLRYFGIFKASSWLRVFTFVFLITIPFCLVLSLVKSVATFLLLRLGLKHQNAILERKMRRLVIGQLSIVTNIYCHSDLVIYGDYNLLNSNDTYIISSNHQIYIDWLVIWIVMKYWKNASENMMIILKNGIFKVPVVGPLIKSLGFIGINRDWKKDEEIIKSSLENLVELGNPTWLLMFPEGTVITADTKARSRTYMKNNNINTNLTNVLLPRSKGISSCADKLKPMLKGIVDVTIAYSGVDKSTYPYDCYSIQGLYFGGKRPSQIHVYFKYHPISTIPGKNMQEQLDSSSNTVSNETLFENWLRETFVHKDNMIKYFQKNEHFYSQEEPIILERPQNTIPRATFLLFIMVIYHYMLFFVASNIIRLSLFLYKALRAV